MPVSRFHRWHGKNISLSADGMVARRRSSFAHAIAFSERPLHPMELFVVEIGENERGWSGHLRLGLTQLDPGARFALPQYALPDLSAMGRSHVFAVTKSHNKVYQDGDGSTYRSILGDGLHVNTYQGLFQRSLLQPLPRLTDSSTAAAAADDDATSDKILPTDVGSRIGIVYVVRDRMAEMHFVINGEDQGACAHDIPYRDASVYAVVDVYGATKQVRIVQLYGVGTLQNACRDIILRRATSRDIERLPIPKKLKDYLRYET